MNFEEALKALKEGKKIAQSKHTPYKVYYYLSDCNIFYVNTSGIEINALFDSIDLLAEDWEVVEE